MTIDVEPTPGQPFAALPAPLLHGIMRTVADRFPVDQPQGALVGLAQADGHLGHGLQNRLKHEGRLADNLQNVAGRGLVGEGFLQIARAGLQGALRLGTGNRDGGLFGEGLQQGDFIAVDRANLEP